MPDNSKLFMPAQDADRLISAHDGDVALLYLYRLRTRCTDNERTARDLCMTLRAVEEACEKLSRLTEAIPNTSSYIPEPILPREIPEYTSADVVECSGDDPVITAITTEAIRIMGRHISSTEQKMLIGIYNHLAMPADVVMLLLNHCGKVFEQKYGTQRRPSMRFIQKEALYWADREILTVEAAENYIDWQNRRTSDVGRIKELLGIRGRELIKSESERINGWLDMGFDESCISIAFERTVTNTGSLKWNYMDKILHSWKEKNLLTAQEIEEKDSRHSAASKVASQVGNGDMSKYFSALDDAINKI